MNAGKVSELIWATQLNRTTIKKDFNISIHQSLILISRNKYENENYLMIEIFVDHVMLCVVRGQQS